MSNRAQRRAIARNQQSRNRQLLAGYDREQRKEQLFRNGITEQDVQDSFLRGVKQGYRMAGEDVLKRCYYAFAVAMHKELGFGHKRAARLLGVADPIVEYAMSSEELADDLLEQVGLKVNFGDALDRVQEVEG